MHVRGVAAVSYLHTVVDRALPMPKEQQLHDRGGRLAAAAAADHGRGAVDDRRAATSPARVGEHNAVASCCQREASWQGKPLGDGTLTVCPTRLVGGAGCNSRPMEADGGCGGGALKCFQLVRQ